jgi:glycosyltransferase involved in cell wall biosynthesis
MQRAGLETVLMNYYREVDRTQIQFDFLVHRSKKSAYENEILSMGGHIFRMPRLYPQNYLTYLHEMSLFFNNHREYQVVHSHIDAMSYLPLLAAKRAHVPIRIAHAHSAGIDRDYKLPLKLWFKSQIPKVSNRFFACGDQAGRFLFQSSNFFIMKNAIPVNKFQYSETRRNIVRKKMKVKENTFVVGCIGRLSYPKNHKFIIDVMARVVKKKSNVVLWIIGDGEYREALQNQIVALGLENVVSLLGSRSNTEDFYQAMDMFVLPSIFEGIPMVGVEAQAAGLPCVFSEGVSDEVVYATDITKLPLVESKWVDKIANASKLERHFVTNFGGYDIHSASPKLVEEYRLLLWNFNHGKE